MSKEVMGVSLSRLEDPIRSALKNYQSASDGLVFDTDKACKLASTPDKPNSARSATDVIFQGEQIGTLYVIAFKPGDGTGTEIDYQLENLHVDSPYPRDARIVPRNKTGIDSEAHMTIVSHNIEDSHAEPQPYAGTFDLLGLDGTRVKKIGRLGHPVSKGIATPVTTFTVGYRGGERFGDPHAVFSTIKAVQVCAFLAISDKVHKDHPRVLVGLRPQLPAKL